MVQNSGQIEALVSSKDMFKNGHMGCCTAVVNIVERMRQWLGHHASAVDGREAKTDLGQVMIRNWAAFAAAKD